MTEMESEPDAHLNAFLEERETRLGLRDGLRAARAAVQSDAESFHTLLYAIERLGKRLHPQGHGLGDYRAVLVDLVRFTDAVGDVRDFERALFLLSKARNDEQHSGAHARSLAKESVWASLVLEAALNLGWPDIEVRDVMTRNPTTAEPWHTLGDVRTTMLANAFTALPLWVENKGWYLLTDEWLARLLVGKGEAKRSEILGRTVAAVAKDGGLALLGPVPPTTAETRLQDCKFDAWRLLLIVEDAQEPKRLLGVVAPADLL
jgi:hypothetical protein